jgi:putative transposase
MPRKPRANTVIEGFQVLKTWRGHNKEWNIAQTSDRLAYLKFLRAKLKKQENILNAYTLMANHTHEMYSIENPPAFSDLMRNHHARYGRYFNDQYQRCGKVAQDRPHTAQIQNDMQAMWVTFYVLANPLRAGLVKDPRNYRFSAYLFYAFGILNKYTEFLTYPDWYMTLGNTPELRQQRFRRLFFRYLRDKGIIKENYSRLPFIGDPLWIEKRNQEVKTNNQQSNPGPDP